MHPFKRGERPVLFAKHGVAVGKAYEARRAEIPNARFRWPRREKQSLYDVARAAAYADTAGHCSYCDGYPIGAQGREEVDHFRPATQFPLLACDWANLFLSCTACNHAKNDQWDELLLRPDDAAFAFDRYFLFRPDNGTLEPNPAAASSLQVRAAATIRVLDLNRVDLCVSRRREFGRNDPDGPYRFVR